MFSGQKTCLASVSIHSGGEWDGSGEDGRWSVAGRRFHNVTCAARSRSTQNDSGQMVVCTRPTQALRPFQALNWNIAAGHSVTGLEIGSPQQRQDTTQEVLLFGLQLKAGVGADLGHGCQLESLEAPQYRFL